MQQFAVKAVEEADWHRRAAPHFDDRLERGLNVRGRLRDDAEHRGRGGLLPQGLVALAGELRDTRFALGTIFTHDVPDLRAALLSDAGVAGAEFARTAAQKPSGTLDRQGNFALFLPIKTD